MTRVSARFVVLSALLFALSAVPVAALDYLYGPEKLVREKGEPQTVLREIHESGFTGPFALNVRNGDEAGAKRCSSAEIRLDGQVVVGPDSFSQKKGGAKVEVALLDRSSLEVTVRSAPGCEIALWIEGTRVAYRIEPILEEALSTTKKIGSEGGSLTASLSDGTRLTLTVPEAALPYATDITLTPLAMSTLLPVGGPLLAGAAFSPPGLAFAVPANLQIELPYPPSNAVSAFRYADGGRDFHAVPFSGGGRSFRILIDHFSGAGLQEGGSATCAALQEHPPSDPASVYDQQVACLPKPPPDDLTPWIESAVAALYELMATTVAQINSAPSLSQAMSHYSAWSYRLMLLHDLIGSALDNHSEELAAMDEEVSTAAHAVAKRMIAAAESACAQATLCSDVKPSLNDVLYAQVLLGKIPGNDFGDLVVSLPALCGELGNLSITTDSQIHLLGSTGQATATPKHVLTDATPDLSWQTTPEVASVTGVIGGTDLQTVTFKATGRGTGSIQATGTYCGLEASGSASITVTDRVAGDASFEGFYSDGYCFAQLTYLPTVEVVFETTETAHASLAGPMFWNVIAGFDYCGSGVYQHNFSLSPLAVGGQAVSGSGTTTREGHPFALWMWLFDATPVGGALSGRLNMTVTWAAGGITGSFLLSAVP